MARQDDDVDDDDDDDDDDRDVRKSKKRTGPSKDDMQMAMFCHLGALFGGIILPLVLWLTQREKSSFIDDQGKEVINFQITIILFCLITCCFGAIIASPLAFVFHIIGGMAASRGEKYRYPMSIRFIK